MESCSFTGHRVIADELVAPLEALLLRAINYVYGEGCRTFYCGGALGFDTMAAKLLIGKRLHFPDIRLIIVAPCIDQADKWSVKDRDIYEYILANADEVIYVEEEYTKSCMKKRNARLASLCDVMIAYSGRTNSGSAQTVRMAEELGKRVYNLFGKER
jgi:uncharacterized phage-like protein YoqJ